METIQNLIEFVMSNGDKIATTLLAAHALAVAVVNLTPTPKDDKIVGKLYKYVEKAAGILSAKAKE